jgi:hypothetical protein
MKNRFILFSIVLLTTICGCKKVEAPSESDANYYPVYIGKSNIYRVDSIYFDAFRKVSDTFQYFVKESIEDIFSESPKQIYVVNRYLSTDSQHTWQLNAQFLLEKSADFVKIKEYNVDLVKLIFPIIDRKTFNINTFNALDVKNARFLLVDQPKKTEQIKYDKCTQVFVQNDSNFFEQKRHIEFYARTVGLIYKEYIDITIQNKEQRGVKYAYTLIEHD